MSAFLKAVFDWTIQNTKDYSADPPTVDQEKIAWLRDAWDHLVTDGATLLRNGLRMAQDPATSEEDRAMVLENLADLVENIDNANVLEPLGGWPVVLGYAQSYRGCASGGSGSGGEKGGEKGSEGSGRDEDAPLQAGEKEEGNAPAVESFAPAAPAAPASAVASNSQAEKSPAERSTGVVYWSLMIIANVIHSNDKGLAAGIAAGLWGLLDDFLAYCAENAAPRGSSGAPGKRLLPVEISKGFIAVFSGVLQSHEHSVKFVERTRSRTATGVLDEVEAYLRGYNVAFPRFDHLRKQVGSAEAGPADLPPLAGPEKAAE